MSRPIVVDLLVLSMCRHPSGKRLDVFDEAYRKLRDSSCWNKAEDLLRRSAISQYPKGSFIYVSRKSYKNLKEVLSNLIDATFQNMENLENFRALRVTVQNILRAERYGVVKSITCRDPCQYTGFHAKEYCELAEALKETLGQCNFECAIVCLDGTFSYDHLIEISRNVIINYIGKGVGAGIYEVVKQ